MNIIDKLNKICKTKQNVPLKFYSNMHCGGNAQYLCMPNSIGQIKKLVKFLNKNDIPFYVIGNGTNVLFKDEDFVGVIISLRKFNKIKSLFNRVYPCSGASLSKLNYFLKTNGLSGLEWSYGIPGTVGGAICMNAGAYGGEIQTNIQYVDCFDKTTNQIVRLKKTEMQFGYRQSIFQNGRYIILKAKLIFAKGDTKTIEQNQQMYIQKRRNTQPISSYNLGSIFKKNEGKSAGQIIDELGLKGYKIGGAYISKLHANFILNDGTATAKDVLDLIEFIKTIVKEKCNITLQEEIKIV